MRIACPITSPVSLRIDASTTAGAALVFKAQLAGCEFAPRNRLSNHMWWLEIDTAFLAAWDQIGDDFITYVRSQPGMAAKLAEMYLRGEMNAWTARPAMKAALMELHGC